MFKLLCSIFVGDEFYFAVHVLSPMFQVLSS